MVCFVNDCMNSENMAFFHLILAFSSDFSSFHVFFCTTIVRMEIKPPTSRKKYCVNFNIELMQIGCKQLRMNQEMVQMWQYAVEEWSLFYMHRLCKWLYELWKYDHHLNIEFLIHILLINLRLVFLVVNFYQN